MYPTLARVHALAIGIMVDLACRSRAGPVQSDDLRQGIKAFSDWPTIPQLYVKGEFVGGSDIVRQMYEAGELKPFLAEQGVITG